MENSTPTLRKTKLFSRFLKSPLKIQPNKLLPSLLPSNEMNTSAIIFQKSESPSQKEKSPVIKRFTVPDLLKTKSNRSLSPVMKFRVEELETEKKIYEKYRVKRIEHQERDIRLQQIGNRLKETLEKGGPENEKIETSLEIIKSLVSYDFSYKLLLFKQIKLI